MLLTGNATAGWAQDPNIKACLYDLNFFLGVAHHEAFCKGLKLEKGERDLRVWG